MRNEEIEISVISNCKSTVEREFYILQTRMPGSNRKSLMKLIEKVKDEELAEELVNLINIQLAGGTSSSSLSGDDSTGST